MIKSKSLIVTFLLFEDIFHPAAMILTLQEWRMLPPLPLLVGGCVVEKRAAAWFSFDVTMVALSYDDDD